jgi:hypothetical protein
VEGSRELALGVLELALRLELLRDHPERYSAGMLAFIRKKFVGSYFALRASVGPTVAR